MTEPRPAATLISNRGRPSKAELEEPVVFPKGAPSKKLACAVLCPPCVKTAPARP